MEKSLKNYAIKISKETIYILIAIASAVVLPQIFHYVGVLLGVGGKLGQIFLPMYIPVLIFGFYKGSLSGAIAGLLSPLVSFSLTAMPSQALLPYITIELVATGFLAGAFSKVKMPAILRVLSVQVLAKIIRLVALFVSLYCVSGVVSASVLFAGIVASIPGVALQLILVTLLIVKKEKQGE